jgi:hypothetical protein
MGQASCPSGERATRGKWISGDNTDCAKGDGQGESRVGTRHQQMREKSDKDSRRCSTMCTCIDELHEVLREVQGHSIDPPKVMGGT